MVPNHASLPNLFFYIPAETLFAHLQNEMFDPDI